MLSICIPVFNFSVQALFQALHTQSLLLSEKIEFIIIDDCSDVSYREQNAFLINNESVQYVLLPQNIGRSKIRNLFISYSQYDYLLFMDCDSEVIDPNFLAKYIKHCRGEKVICGGRVYDSEKPNEEHYLRWLYGSKRECLSAEVRNENPYKSFMTNNFIISKSILKKIKFNENFQGYGHEDTLFGFELFQYSYKIHHIDNPLLHIGLENSIAFLEKTKQGIKNLNLLHHRLRNSTFINSIRLLVYYKKMRKFGINKILKILFPLFKPFIESNLKGKSPSLFLFDVYKIGLFCQITD